MIDSALAAPDRPPADGELTFLEARRVLAGFSGGPRLEFLLGMSGTADPLSVYLEAAAARRGRSAATTFLPFGTLGQFLNSAQQPHVKEALLVFPWDLAPELDWRSGVPADRVQPAEILARARDVATLATKRGCRLLYIAAPTPPVCGTASDDAALRHQLDALAAMSGCVMLPPQAFSLSGYFTSGCPVAGAWLGRVAGAVVSSLLLDHAASAKLLVTDLDNTLWGGIVGEDGVEGLALGPSASGFRHYVYQSLLRRLRREGALLAAVSRNDQAIVDQALASDSMMLSAADFVSVRASYLPKSAQIRDLAQRLNIGLDAVVFVDDNPIEQAEVRGALPQVRVIAFPGRDNALPEFLDTLAGAFARAEVTSEDRERTDLYRRRADGELPSGASGADLTQFLQSLRMRLDMRDRSNGDRTRAVQLINKTN
ncbi:MAG TPA: HAD-IIIC family phosphatase, partial [Gemmatimonadaceae bacterium]